MTQAGATHGNNRRGNHQSHVYGRKHQPLLAKREFDAHQELLRTLRHRTASRSGGAEPHTRWGKPMAEKHRITESQHVQDWPGPLWVTQPNPLPKQGHPEQAAEHRGQAGLEYLQRRRLHSLPGQPGPGLRHPQREEVLPRVQGRCPEARHGVAFWCWVLSCSGQRWCEPPMGFFWMTFVGSSSLGSEFIHTGCFHPLDVVRMRNRARRAE